MFQLLSPLDITLCREVILVQGIMLQILTNTQKYGRIRQNKSMIQTFRAVQFYNHKPGTLKSNEKHNNT
jgi:hypothetical protein